MAEKVKKEENLIRGFCNPKCIYYQLRTIPCFTNESHTIDVDICNYNGTARSFGCMSTCLNGKPQLEEDESKF